MDSGWLSKQGNSIRKGWRPRWFWVEHETHSLKYAEKPGEKPLGVIPFATTQAKVNNSSAKPFAIDFVTPNRTYFVAAKSQEEQLAWIDLFRKYTKAAIEGIPISSNSSSATLDGTPVDSSGSTSPRCLTPSDATKGSASCISPRASPSTNPNMQASSEIGSPAKEKPLLLRVMSAWRAVTHATERGNVLLKDSKTDTYVKKYAEVRGENLFMYSSEAKAAQRRLSSASIVLTMCQVRHNIPNFDPSRRDSHILSSSSSSTHQINQDPANQGNTTPPSTGDSEDPQATQSPPSTTDSSRPTSSSSSSSITSQPEPPAEISVMVSSASTPVKIPIEQSFALVTPNATLYFISESLSDAKRWIRLFDQIYRVTKQRARANSIADKSLLPITSSPSKPSGFKIFGFNSTQSKDNQNEESAHSKETHTSAEEVLSSPSNTGVSTTPSSKLPSSNDTPPSSANTAPSLQRTQSSSSDDSTPTNQSSGASGKHISPPPTQFHFRRHLQEEEEATGANPRFTVESSFMPFSRSSAEATPTSNDTSSTTTTFSSPSSYPNTILSPYVKEIPVIGLESLEANMQKILHLAAEPQNSNCADCREAEPQWASINLGIFICLECSGIHRSLGVHISKVRSIDLDKWDEHMIETMASIGNVNSNKIFEAELEQSGSKHPPSTASRDEKAKFIRSKYVDVQWVKVTEGNEHNIVKPRLATAPVRHSARLISMLFQEGSLNISRESEKRWKQRWAVLKDNKLLIYKSRADPEPRQVVFLGKAHLKSTSSDRINTFELIVPEDALYLQTDNSSDFFVWMDIIRTSQKLYKSVTSADFEEASPGEVFRAGWLYKQGESFKNWKRRWFVLKDNKLSYYASSTDRTPKGSIALPLSVPKDGTHEGGTPIKGLPDQSFSWTFEIVVTGRVYIIATTSQNDSKEWIEAIKHSKKFHEHKVAVSLATAQNRPAQIPL